MSTQVFLLFGSLGYPTLPLQERQKVKLMFSAFVLVFAGIIGPAHTLSCESGLAKLLPSISASSFIASNCYLWTNELCVDLFCASVSKMCHPRVSEKPKRTCKGVTVSIKLDIVCEQNKDILPAALNLPASTTRTIYTQIEPWKLPKDTTGAARGRAASLSWHAVMARMGRVHCLTGLVGVQNFGIISFLFLLYVSIILDFMCYLVSFGRLFFSVWGHSNIFHRN